MIGTNGIGPARHRRARAVLGVCVGLFFGLGSTGCADHRMSLDAFLDLQSRVEQQAVPEPGPEPANLQALLDTQLGPFRVGPGDVLQVTLTGADPTPVFPTVQVRVDREGQIELPVVGAIPVANLELEDVEDAVRAVCVPHLVRDGVVHVALVSEATTDVLVVGAVTLPSLVPLRRTERDMLHAIVSAGGVSEIASGDATLQRIRRPGEEVTLNLYDPRGVQAALDLDPLEDGDIVTVHSAMPNTIFVGGLVNAPAPQVYAPGVPLTVLQALAAAQGLRTDVRPREATLIRRMPDGTDAHVKLDLLRVTSGQDPNIRLAAGDILWVPETVDTMIEDWINRNVVLRASANVTYNVTGIEYMNRRSQQNATAGASRTLTTTPGVVP